MLKKMDFDEKQSFVLGGNAMMVKLSRFLGHHFLS
jgi:hypothetical protein